MNPNPYPNGRWTAPSPVPQRVADAGRAMATPTARPSCLDISSRKWLRAPVAPDLLAATLHELFWGAPDTEVMSEARARIELVIERAMGHSQFFQPQEAAYVSPAC